MPGLISRPTCPARSRLGVKSTTTAITNFARVSKSQVASEKEVLLQASALQTTTTTIEIVLPRKRKAAEDLSTVVADAPSNTQTCKKSRRETRPVAAATSKLSLQAQRKRKSVTFAVPDASPAVETPSTPPATTKRKRCASPPNTESEQPEDLLQRLQLASPVARKRTKTSVKPKSEETDLPVELLSLLDIHLAFLRALSLYFAHHSSSAPVDLAEICSRTTQIWGKRKIHMEDIRRCLGVLGWAEKTDVTSTAPYFLFELSRTKTCLELCDPADGAFQQHKWHMDFESNLRALWAARRETNIKAFVATLPLAVVRACPRPSPFLARGQRALEELKNGVVRKQEEKASLAQAIPTVNADGSKMSVLDRIRYKELAQAQVAKGPTAAELQRQAALQRAGDVAAVIAMLTKATATGQARVSFTMAAVLGKLKDSIRVPISPDEAEACVKMLASEVMPQWLRVVTIGGRGHVVVQTAMEPSKAAVEAKVNALGC